jgi:hypothetical protein
MFLKPHSVHAAVSTEKKKRFLASLIRFFVTILRPPFLVLRFVIGNLYKLCFGWYDKRMSNKQDLRFADEIRTHLSFLFTEHDAHIVPNDGVPFPHSFDGAYVTIAVGTIRLRFIRGRGDFSVRVASEFAPRAWEEFVLAVTRIGGWDMSQPQPRPYSYSLEDFESILRPRLGLLQQSLSKDHFEATLNKYATRESSTVN